MPSLRIHPAIGVARLGNSQQSFVGPEEPGIPGNWDSGAQRFRAFRDEAGKILRQAARFRIFQFDDTGNAVKEITLADGVKITWTVHVANRKASFFTFNGQSGAETDPPYTRRAARNPNEVEKEDRGTGQPERKNLRNPGVAKRSDLEIDPGPVSISTPGTSELRDSQTPAPIKLLGHIQMESEGRLLVLGGFGETQFQGPVPHAIDEYASNDGWFDDMSDGLVSASVTFPDGHTEEAAQAWVIVGPPKFAPGICNVVSLYDTVWDLAVRNRMSCQAGNDFTLRDLVAQQQAWQSTTNDFAPAYVPSFTQHIYPILSRAFAARDVHKPPTGFPDYHLTLPDWPRLSQGPDPQFRQAIFKRIRNPNSNVLDYKNMPRGLGDDYTTLDDFEVNGSPQPSARAFLSVTQVQYALLKVWAEGRFTDDWTFGSNVRFAPIPAPSIVTPQGLDQAALENCVGGPFYPGIEVSWLIRHTSLYASAFRLRKAGFLLGPLTFGAGFFSQQMALPWQADFYDCHKEEHTPDGSPEPLFYMWWTAQRPDDIRAIAGDNTYRRWVEPFDAASQTQDPDDVANLARFEQMRTRWFELKFVILDGEDFVEEK